MSGRAEKVLAVLEKAWGAPRLPRRLDRALDFVVYGVVATKCPPEVALRAFQTLARDFVDWNEMRVATWREIGDTLERARVPDPGRKAFQLKRGLMQLFSRLNKVTLDSVDTMAQDEAARYLSGLTEFPPQAAGAVLFGRLGVKHCPASDALARVCDRLGLVRGTSPGRVEAELKRLLPRQAHFRFHQLVSALSDEICIEKEPRCGECPLRSLCETGRDWKPPEEPESTRKGGKPARATV